MWPSEARHTEFGTKVNAKFPPISLNLTTNTVTLLNAPGRLHGTHLVSSRTSEIGSRIVCLSGEKPEVLTF